MRTIQSAIPIVAGLLLLAACSESPKSAAPPKSVLVGVITARSESVPAVVEAPGTVQPRDRVVLSSQINGFVREVRVRAGDTVAAG
jgi:multidrug efflux pump subunit AcrA (membrane-fusion protein)